MADASRTLEIIISARDEASKAITGFKGKFNSLMSDIRPGAIALTGLGLATVGVAKGMVEAAGKMEATKTAFNVLIGNTELATQTLNDLMSLEARTPFTLETIMSESKKLLAMGTDAKDLTKTLTMLGDVASGVGFEKLPQLTLAFGQIQAKGRLMGTELRQLTEAGFNLADAMGISNEKLDQLVTDKAVKFEDVAAAFAKVTGEGGRFSGMMDALSLTTTGRLSTLESSIFKLQAALGTALLPALNTIVTALVPAMESFAAWAAQNETLVTIMVAAGLALGALGAAILILGPIIAGFGTVFALLGSTITTVTTIVGSIIAILGGPLTIIILAVMALIALFALAWKNNWFGIRDTVDTVVAWFKNTALPGIKGFIDNLRQMIENFVDRWVARWNMAKAAVEAVVGAIRAVISAAEDLARRAASGLRIPGFQHGGFVPGGSGDAVPAILHGGERVIPRTGVDVNPGGGGGINLSLTFTGPVSMDSKDRVQELADQVISIMGRNNELASKGLI